MIHPAGKRAKTPTDDSLDTIRDAILAFTAAGPPPDNVLAISMGSPWYIGPRMRFVALPDGGALEVQDGGGTWIEQTRWTET